MGCQYQLKKTKKLNLIQFFVNEYKILESRFFVKFYNKLQLALRGFIKTIWF